MIGHAGGLHLVMVIKRHKHTSRFTTVPNSIFEDRRLSAEARGMLGYLLTKSPRWHVDMRDIARAMCMGIEKAHRCMAELQSVGYARRIKARNERGQFEQQDYLVSDIPQSEDPSTAKPDMAEPRAANPDAGISTDSDQQQNEENTRGRGRERGRDVQEATKDRLRDQLRRQMKERADEQ